MKKAKKSVFAIFRDNSESWPQGTENGSFVLKNCCQDRLYIESLSSTTIHKVWLKNCHDLKFISPLWKLKNEHFDLQAIASVVESYRIAP